MRAGKQTRIWLNEVLTLHLRMERLDLVMKSKDWLAHNDFHKAKTTSDDILGHTECTGEIRPIRV